MIKFTTLAELRAGIATERAKGKKIGFVPTMGALHEGHIHLGTTAKKSCDSMIYSIFVNPLQFAPHEDFGRYPRTLDADIARLEAAGMTMVYIPPVEEIYPEDFRTLIHVDGISGPLEGEFRPAFFDGVATVVAKLLLQVLPDQAYFGEKDYQQLQVIKRLAGDLNLPMEIIGVPTVRDDNGLALSSRNAYLSPEQYQVACTLNRTLAGMAELARQGQSVAQIEAMGEKALLDAGFTKVDYCTLRDAGTLQSPQTGRPQRVLAAAWLGTTRLIDNLAV